MKQAPMTDLTTETGENGQKANQAEMNTKHTSYVIGHMFCILGSSVGSRIDTFQHDLLNTHPSYLNRMADTNFTHIYV